MVGGGEKGRISMLARCSVVNHHGDVMLDTYVAPVSKVTDYRTRWSGIRAYNLIGGKQLLSMKFSVNESDSEESATFQSNGWFIIIIV